MSSQTGPFWAVLLEISAILSEYHHTFEGFMFFWTKKYKIVASKKIIDITLRTKFLGAL